MSYAQYLRDLLRPLGIYDLEAPFNGGELEAQGQALDGVLNRLEEVQRLSAEVRDAAQRIIEAKNATSYGIGMSLVRICRAVLGNENSVLTVSAMLRGEYGRRGLYAGAPCIVNANGVDRVLELSLTEEEGERFQASCQVLEESYEGMERS